MTDIKCADGQNESALRNRFALDCAETAKHDMADIKSMLPEELTEYFESIGERAFRTEQVIKWLHGGVKTFAEMTNLSEKLRAKLEEDFYITVPELVKKQESKLDGTIKYLWRTIPGDAIESVVMQYAHGNTVCISTQAGCRMGCAFCASTVGGLKRNLSASEMLDQVLYSQIDSGRKISNIVLMGVGEPLDNFDNVVRFLKLVNLPSGMNIGARHITLSTCGIPEKIDKLSDYGIQLTLSVSLHAPDDETRSRLMPSNRGVDDLLDVCRRYFAKTGRRVTYEYAMIDGVNDTLYHAELLAEKLKDTGSHLNLILLNDVFERPLRKSQQKSVKAFTNILRQKGINHTFRRSLGGDIDAACGQLRASVK